MNRTSFVNNKKNSHGQLQTNYAENYQKQLFTLGLVQSLRLTFTGQ